MNQHDYRCLLPLAFASVVSSLSLAETGGGAPAKEGTSTESVIEEVIVTSQKRKENLQSVPISVNAFTGEYLADKGIDSAQALQTATPGLTFNQSFGFSIIYLRGVGSDAYLPSADPSVATYIDNVYLPFGQSHIQSFGGVERIEVLKGPQGTLFGRNTTGGALNITTKKPSQTFEASVDIERSRFDNHEIRGYTNVPLSDRAALSLGAFYTEANPYYEPSADSPLQYLRNDTAYGGRLKLALDPLDNLSILLSATLSSKKDSVTMLVNARDIKPLGHALGVTEQPDYVSGFNLDPKIDAETEIYSADLLYTAPWFDSRLILSTQRVDAPAQIDFDGSGQPLVAFEALSEYLEQETAELQFLSNEESWLADRLQWILGVYYLRSTGGFGLVHLSVGTGLFDSVANPNALPGISPVSGLLGDALAILQSNANLPAILDPTQADVTLAFEGLLQTRSISGFFQGSYDISDWITVTLGGRIQHEERALVKATSGIVLDPEDRTRGTTLLDRPREKVSDDNFSPKLTLDFEPVEDQLLFLTFARGYKSGTYNIVYIYSDPEYILPEEVTSYELGYKSTWYDKTLRLNAGIFRTEIDNLQTQIVSLLAGGAIKFENAGSARIQGIDVDFIWKPLPSVAPNLEISGGASYLDSEYTDYRQGSGYDPSTGIFCDGTLCPKMDFTGNRIARTPKISATLALSYLFTLPHYSTLEIAGDVYYSDGFYASAQNSPRSLEEDYQVFNARAIYMYSPLGLKFTGFVNNINNAKYHAVIQENDFATAKVLAPPRTYGVRLGWAF